jgi:acyl-CoA thioester hydrolase
VPLTPRFQMLESSPVADPHVSSTLVRVPFYDTDAMGVVHHANYLRYFENGRVDWFRKRGVLYGAGLGPNLHLAAIESHAKYLSAARFDDLLVVQVRLTELHRISMKFSYTIANQADGRVVAQGDTLHACVSDEFRLKRIPVLVREALMMPERGATERVEPK